MKDERTSMQFSFLKLSHPFTTYFGKSPHMDPPPPHPPFEVQKVPRPKFRGIGHHVVSYFFGIKGVELLKKNQKRMKQGG